MVRDITEINPKLSYPQKGPMQFSGITSVYLWNASEPFEAGVFSAVAYHALERIWYGKNCNPRGQSPLNIDYFPKKPKIGIHFS